MDESVLLRAFLAISLYLIDISCHIDKEEFNHVFMDIGSYVNESRNFKKIYYAAIGPFTSWIKTRKLCHKYGLEFIRFDTDDEFSHAKLLLRKRRMGRVRYPVSTCKVGAYRKANHTWYWVDTGKPMNIYIRWARGQPNYVNNTRNCLLMMIKTDIIYFEAIDCRKSGDPFMCQKTMKLQNLFARPRTRGAFNLPEEPSRK